MINRHCDRKAIGNKEQQVNNSVINTSGLNKKTVQNKSNTSQKLNNYSTMQSNVRNYKKKPGHVWEYQNYQNNHYNNRDIGYYNKGFKPNNKNYNNQRFNNQNNYDTKYDSTNNSVTPPTPSSGSHSLNTTTSPTSDSASSSAAVNNNSNQNTNQTGTNVEVKPTNNQNSNEIKKVNSNNCTNSLTKEFAEWSLDLPNDKEVKPNNLVKMNYVNKTQVTQENSANVNSNKNTIKNTKNLQSKFYQMFVNVNKPNYHTYRNKKQVNNCLIKNTSSNQSNIPNIKNSHQKQIQQSSNPVKNYYDGSNSNAPVSQNHPSMVSPYITPNGVFYSFPTGQYFTPHQHHLNPHSSQNQPMPNTHPSNCLECQQQNNSYYNGNNFIAPSYHSFATPFLSLQHYPIQTAHTNQTINNANANLAPTFNAEIGHFLPQIPYNPYLHFVPPNYITVPNNESHQINTNLIPNSNLVTRNFASNSFSISQPSGQPDYTSNGESSSYENSRSDSNYEYGVNENRNNLVSNMHNQVSYNDQVQNMSNGHYLANPNCYSAEYNNSGNIMPWQNYNNSKNAGDDLSSHSLVVNFSNENSENGFNDTNTLANSKNTELSDKK